MDTEPIQKLINESDSLSDEQKVRWLKKLPRMTDKQIERLVEILTWARQQKTNIKEEKKLILGGVLRIFTKMNKYSIKKAQKETLALFEKKLSQAESANSEQIIRNINI